MFNTDLMQDKQINSRKGVLDFLSTTPKNRLVFDLNNSLEIDCIDIGYQLASTLKDMESPSMLVGNVINRLILEHKSFDNSLGYVIAFIQIFYGKYKSFVYEILNYILKMLQKKNR